jgi:hypothetical protein
MKYRYALGEVIRETRHEQTRTLRWTAQRASMALGYLSEIERGKKEVSSELLSKIAQALRLPTSQLIIRAGYKMSLDEEVCIPVELCYENVIQTLNEPAIF